MKTIRDLIDDVRNLIHISSNDLDDRVIVSWINGQRALWLKNEMNKGMDADDNILQTLPCLELEVADASLCGLVNTKHRILRTINEIPKAIVTKYNNGIYSIRRPIMLDIKFNHISREEAVRAGSGRFNKGDIFAFLYNNRIWIKLLPDNLNINFITYISIEGLFTNPLDVSELTDCNNKPCFDPEYDKYPINDAMWQYMINAIYDNRVKLLAGGILDPIPDTDVHNSK